MQKWVGVALVIVLALLFVTLSPSPSVSPFPPLRGPSEGASASSSPATFSATSTSFEEVVSAHGGRKAIAAVAAFKVEAVRLSVTSMTDFFARQVAVSVDGEKFKRRSAAPLGLRTEIEWLDERGVFHATAITRALSGEAVPESLPNDAGRLREVKFMVEISSLLPTLQRAADAQVRVVAAARAAQGLDKFTLVKAAGTLIVYADRSHLIQRVEIGDKVLQFADYRVVDRLRLPFIQRLSVGNRLFYEWFVSTFDLHPTFPPGFFNQAD